MRSATPCAIAYVAVQVNASENGAKGIILTAISQLRFALSSATSWNEQDGCFNYPMFYNNIVDFFEDTPGPAAQADVHVLLSWWTM
jgi:hypothetical protein